MEKMMTTTSPSNLPFELAEKLANLENLIKEKHPRMPTLLQEIHSALRQQHENVVLLSEEEISCIVEGLKIQTGVSFAASAVSAKSAATKKLKGVTADML
jgi:hypothetical protein